MRRNYSWGQILVVVEAPDKAHAYRVVLSASGINTTPMAIDAHWGADDASRVALDIYARAFADTKRFLAEERTEARHMPTEDRASHIRWAETVVEEAATLGQMIEEAVQVSIRAEPPLDISASIDEYLGLTELGHEMAIAALKSEGRSLAEAEETHAKRTLRDFTGKWRFAPSRRLPTAARG